jgi:hypothetical protein
MTHGVSGVDWRFYKHPLPDSVYDVYMKYWADVSFEVSTDILGTYLIWRSTCRMLVLPRTIANVAPANNA